MEKKHIYEWILSIVFSLNPQRKFKNEKVKFLKYNFKVAFTLKK